ncbi:MAG: HEXXH motif-containing putative peptide modification protein [Acidobacteriota bacterium]
MDDLAERIKGAIENPNGELWFPDLTADLAARAWESLHHDIGLTPDSYGTERVLSRSHSASREVITSLKTCPSICATAPTISIEALTPECAVQYKKQGVTFYTPDEIFHTSVLSCIEEALAIINQVPSLMRTVAALVRTLHIIKPEKIDYDVSFSEPQVPFSIFVSVPEKRIPNDALRVAEAMVHEAMHLQLTLIEKTVALAVASSTEIFSPWRGEYRTVNGVLHGLYVFRVIQQFLRAVREPFADNVAHIESRCIEISSQMRSVRGFEGCSDLTRIGAALAKI